MKILVVTCYLFLYIVLTQSSQEIINNTPPPHDPSQEAARIIDGNKPQIGQYSFVAKLQWMFYYDRPVGATDWTLCTAVVLTGKFVMTTASCFQIIILNKHKKEDTTLDVELTRAYGRTFVHINQEMESGETSRHVRAGVRLIVHSAYMHPSTMFDVNIALVQIQPWWNLRPGTKLKLPRLSLNLAADDPNNYKCIGVGSGKVVNSFYSWEDMNKTWFDVTMGGVGYCKYLHKEFNQRNVHVDSFYICTKTKRQGQDFCGGDLGAALICNGMLSGLLSQRVVNNPCQTTGRQFTMFTAVGAPKVFDWIKTYVPDVKTPLPIPPDDPWNGTMLWA